MWSLDHNKRSRIAYILLVLVVAIGFFREEQVAHKSQKVAEVSKHVADISKQIADITTRQVKENAKNVRDNKIAFCKTSRSRWKVAHDQAIIFSEPIPLPPKVDADGKDNSYNYLRTVLRNDQLAKERAHILSELGQEPKLC